MHASCDGIIRERADRHIAMIIRSSVEVTRLPGRWKEVCEHSQATRRAEGKGEAFESRRGSEAEAQLGKQRQGIPFIRESYYRAGFVHSLRRNSKSQRSSRGFLDWRLALVNCRSCPAILSRMDPWLERGGRAASRRISRVSQA
jgi:hypothetical protein